ncbi:hypothetical protein E4U43_003811 [Claviceps pusilla]|uniref:C2H2-type domain-containing protein n=1 Tax=Claviceps pusilla TaxID=123648 RepID=A0A9P7N6R1_9HYPO|nr:hypothetical protein E4U43_003811 [Claviceps pusilla]
MPKAEVGSTKHLANKLKSKGLQRLRWYCQVCEKQCRDANGFKMHTQSESHVRQMLVVGEDPKKYINQFSDDFLRDFLQLLKTGHGEKQVNMNHFYQEYIANKEHIHMNATRWPSLTEFAKYLGKEGICRVEETDKGIHISWIDNSPEALRRQEALRRKEAQDQGDEQLEQRMIREQIRRAQQASAAAAAWRGEGGEGQGKEEERELRRQDGDQKITLSFGSSKARSATETSSGNVGGEEVKTPSLDSSALTVPGKMEESTATNPKPAGSGGGGGGGISMKLGAKPQTKNVFAQAKKNALASGSKKHGKIEQPKKMSEAERIMRQEMDRKRSRESAGFGFNMSSGKKQRNI